ncbi:MAG: hypothetical protein ACRDKG_16380 [Actinomycetota bacterium]
MARVRWLLLVVLVLAMAVPGEAAARKTVGCADEIRSGGSASCVLRFRIPHFNARDAIDYESLVARIVSPQALGWRVKASISDARGVVYFAWDCAARRSMVAANSSAHFDRTCQAWRRSTSTGTPYVARTSKPQVLRVTAWVGGCLSTVENGCRFEASAAYLLR